MKLIKALTDAGYAVETAPTRQRALSRCAERTYDAITLDLLLPDATGLDLVADLRAGGLNARTPIVVVSVVAEREAMGGFRVHDVLGKPLDRDRLLVSLERSVAPVQKTRPRGRRRAAKQSLMHSTMTHSDSRPLARTASLDLGRRRGADARRVLDLTCRP